MNEMVDVKEIDLKLRNSLKSLSQNMIYVGSLLKLMKETNYYLSLGYLDWHEYLKDVGLSLKTARRLISVFEVFGNNSEAYEIPYTKLLTIKDTPELLEDAKVLNVRDLQHLVQEKKGDKRETCTHYNMEIFYVKFQRCKECGYTLQKKYTEKELREELRDETNNGIYF